MAWVTRLACNIRWACYIIRLRRRWAVADETVAVGDVAPGFTLKDHKETEATLSGLRGKKVVLYIGEILAALEEFQVTPG